MSRVVFLAPKDGRYEIRIHICKSKNSQRTITNKCLLLVEHCILKEYLHNRRKTFRIDFASGCFCGQLLIKPDKIVKQ